MKKQELQHLFGTPGRDGLGTQQSDAKALTHLRGDKKWEYKQLAAQRGDSQRKKLRPLT